MHVFQRRPAAPRAWAAIFLISLAPLACSSSDDTTGSSASSGTPDGGGGQPDGSVGDPNVLVGTFQVRLNEPIPAMNGNPATPGTTSVLGKIYDGPTPSQLIWEAKTKEGDCQVFTPKVPFCNTPCGGSAVCVADDQCEPYPTAHSAGAVKASGLHAEGGASEFTMNPIANNYQPPVDVKLLYPAFSEGEAIRFEASGEYFSAFAIDAKGIAPFELTSATPIPVESGKPISLAWKAGAKDLSTIHVKLDISHHGGTKGMIECDTADTGSLDIAASLVTELLNLGVAGFPSIIISRNAKGSTTIAPGRVDLTITSSVERAVDIPGLASCTADGDCPGGQKCQSDLTCK